MELSNSWLWLFIVMCSSTIASCSERFIFYDVNPGEGFNLRRDVFMRIAIFVKKLNQEENSKFTLVLPPWGRLYHWQSRELGYQVKIQWKSFFDTDSINRYVPVIDLEDYLKTHEPVIDSVVYLQNYKEGWKSGEFVEKFDFRDCIDKPRYIKDEESNLYTGWFWNYDQMRARDFKCVSVQGQTSVLKDFVLNMEAKTIMLDRAEHLLHDTFGDAEYWSVRRSMRFADSLVKIADEFRREHLDSDDKKDGTELEKRWEDFETERGSARGGPYLCVHLRRKDYVRSRSNQIPDLRNAAEQIRRKLKESQLETVFVSTDAPQEEFEEFKTNLNSNNDEFNVIKFIPSKDILHELKDGGVAIVDQSICSHASLFIGSPESTFTFRIQEEREIMGFRVEQTFQVLCPNGKFDCEKGSVWKIVYPPTQKKKKEPNKERNELWDFLMCYFLVKFSS